MLTPPTINHEIIAHESVEQLMHKGSIAYQQDNIPQALTHFMQAAQQKPNDCTITNNCAFLLKKLRHFDEAIDWYKKVLELVPNHAQANLGIGYAYLAQGNFQLGWQQFEWRWSQPPTFNRAFKQYIDAGQPLKNKKIFWRFVATHSSKFFRKNY
jgi:tetratricopeptide (TPR) repeat protein